MTSNNEQWIVEQLVILAVALDAEVKRERFKIYANDLRDLSREQLEIAFCRARRELQFFPKLAELRALAGPGIEDEVAAWDLIIKFVDKYVGNDVHGNFGPEHGWYPKTFPKLAGRILDTVRRTGGWRAYKLMTEKDFPFMQKRFLEQYRAWDAVASIEPSRLLSETQQRQLTGSSEEASQQETFGLADVIAKFRDLGKPMGSPKSENPLQTQGGTKASDRSIPTPPTPAELRDRAEVVKAARPMGVATQCSNWNRSKKLTLDETGTGKKRKVTIA